MALNKLIIFWALYTLSEKADACTLPFESVAGGCYYYSFKTGVIVDSYQVAENLCNGDGGSLAIVDTEDKNIAIKEYFFVSDDPIHKNIIGARLNEEGQFEWTNGVSIDETFSNWADGQPSGDGECMGYSRQHNLTWDDFQCDGFFAEDLNVGFICESNTTEETTIATETTTAAGTMTSPETSATISEEEEEEVTTVITDAATAAGTMTSPETSATISEEEEEEVTTVITDAATYATTGTSVVVLLIFSVLSWLLLRPNFRF